MAAQSDNEPTIPYRTIKTIKTIHQSDNALAIAIANNVGTALSSAALPLAAVVIAYMFKIELAALLARLRSFKALGVEASLDTLIQETLPPVAASDQVASSSTVDQLPSSASRIPIEVIASSWLGVEAALRRATAALPGSNTMSVRSRAASLPSIPGSPTGLVERVTELFSIRGRVLHNPDAIISADSLMLYEENARRAISELSAITPNG